MRIMRTFSVLLLIAIAGVASAFAADVPAMAPVMTNREAARPGDGPALQDGGAAGTVTVPTEGTIAIPDRPVRSPAVGAMERPEKGSARYIMVLWESGTPVPGDAAKKIIKKVAEPDIPKLGGKVLFSRGNQRVIELPLKEARKLRRHEAVLSLQRLWTGESRGEWAEPSDTEPAAASKAKPANSRLAVKTDVDTNLEWGPLTYGYDGSGNIKQTSTTANTDSYVYDSAGRLIQATVKGQTETYAYDAFGNMTAKGITGGASTTIPVDGGSNRLIGPTYDAAGNVLSRDGLEAYEYDSFNMLSKYRRPLAFFPYTLEMVYDPDDERLGVLLQDGSSRWSVRDLGGQVIREYDGFRYGNDLILMWQADYIRGEGGQLLAGETPAWQYNDQNGNGTTTAQYGGIRHYHLDHLGSVRLVTDASKRTLGEHDYYPYGVTPTKAYQEELNPGTPHIDPMRYAGHQRDFLGYLNVENTDYLDYMHARYYDPKLGRFLSVDPVLDMKRATRQPQGWNRYSYVMNNPMRYTDPTGKYTCDGTATECKAYEASLSIVRAAAAEAARKHLPSAGRLSAVVALYGKANDANGVSVTFGTSSLGGSAETTVSRSGEVAITIDRTQFGADLRNGNYVKLASRAAHEADHGLRKRANPDLMGTTSRAMVTSMERGGYRAGGYIYEALGFSDTHKAIWQTDIGWTPLLEQWTKISVDAYCDNIGGCSP